MGPLNENTCTYTTTLWSLRGFLSGQGHTMRVVEKIVTI